MTGRDSMKFCIADSCGGEQRAINHRPTNLQRAQIVLGKCTTGQISRRHRQLLAVERAQILSEQSDFLELSCCRGDRFADIGELEKF